MQRDSSFETTPAEFGRLIRSHWSIEKRLHRKLDVNFREDASKAKKDNTPLNLPVLRKIALFLLRNAATSKKLSLPSTKLRAAFNPDSLELLLLGG